MEKSWIFWNFEIFWNFWKSLGILTKNGQGHGKDIQLTCMSISRSWNFVMRSWKNQGKVTEFCRDNFVATLLLFIKPLFFFIILYYYPLDHILCYSGHIICGSKYDFAIR